MSSSQSGSHADHDDEAGELLSRHDWLEFFQSAYENDDENDGFPELEVLIEEIADDGLEGSQYHEEDEEEEEEEEDAGLSRRIIRLARGLIGRPYLTQSEFLALLRGQDVNPVFHGDSDGIHRLRFSVGRGANRNKFPKVPSDEGRKLMESGAFGTYDWREHNRKGLARRLLDRELGLGGRSGQKINQGLMAQQMIPSAKPEMVVHFEDPVCCGQFSSDGNFFYACVKDFRVRMYDTSNPYNWKHYKTVPFPFGQWTMTDADLSPDNKWLCFSSLQSNVGIAATDPNDTGDPYSLNLADGGRNGMSESVFGGFAIFSVRFSGDGRQIVAGTGADSIVVYDIERRKPLHHVRGHSNDVNAVCFADKLSPHILYSGSDDCTIKVWDTRSLGDGREAGAFVGHTEGLTYIDSKGDGRYVLSNGKDQSMKLWDLRMAMSTTQFRELDPTSYTRSREYEYDYRWQDYHDYQWFQHPHDNSLVTFRGHKVQRTLIRCHFSPPNSTDSRYVYSGSYDGHVYVWNLDATLAAKIDVRSATKSNVRMRPERRHRLRHRDICGWEALVRDVGWHPNAPIFVASAWSGPAMDGGTASLHSYNECESDEGEPEMGASVNEKLQPYREPEFVRSRGWW
ncbi:WD40-repeat-containing domain protein [Madurella fahalii]|uniref:WD40-repeat-containing domain protein n=1 Tax=Madurella fahalii TaxID=1157608 RepID=A0ABQ0G3E8_9PEZI